MEEIICYTDKIPSGQYRPLNFWDILLDDAWADGSFRCPDSVYAKVGNLNQKLGAKQNYEFLLRAALHFPILAIGANETGHPVETGLPVSSLSSLSCATPAPQSGSLEASGSPEAFDSLEASDSLETSGSLEASDSLEAFGSLEAFRTDCYIVGKYQQMLLEKDCFNVVVANLLELASAMPWKERGIAFLEAMISHTPEFYAIDDNTCPILIYKETDMCCNLLNCFIDQLELCFLARRQRVELFDASVEGAQALTRYIGRRFKAIIGIQSYLFSIRMQDGSTCLHDLIHGPKYNLIMDHPAWLKDHLSHAPKDCCLLIHDRNYIRFVQRYFPGISSCLRFPLGGFLPDSPQDPACAAKPYGISFIASYRNYRERLKTIHKYDRKHRFLAARYLSIMKKDPNLPAEEALRMALAQSCLKIDDVSFLNLFYDMRQVYFAVLLYYREKVVRTLLDAGLTVHVFGESWQDIPCACHPCLVRHPSVEASKSLTVMQQSRISLNVMAWHKDGMTERILNAMLCGSVALTDQSTALMEEFENNTDILMFSLTEIERLPARLHSLLSPENSAKLQAIADNGRQKALQNHLWQRRADMLLELWDGKD